MIGYVTLGSDNLPRARRFYDELLDTTLGATRLMELGEEAGGFTMWGTGFDKPGIAVTNPFNKAPASAGNGNMTAIAVNTRAKVDELHARAMELGGSCEHSRPKAGFPSRARAGLPVATRRGRGDPHPGPIDTL